MARKKGGGNYKRTRHHSDQLGQQLDQNANQNDCLEEAEPVG